MTVNPPCTTKEHPFAQEAFTITVQIPRDFSNLPPSAPHLAQKAGEAAGIVCPTCASRKSARTTPNE